MRDELAALTRAPVLMDKSLALFERLDFAQTAPESRYLMEMEGSQS
jgi:hypothetical protein